MLCTDVYFRLNGAKLEETLNTLLALRAIMDKPTAQELIPKYLTILNNSTKIYNNNVNGEELSVYSSLVKKAFAQKHRVLLDGLLSLPQFSCYFTNNKVTYDAHEEKIREYMATGNLSSVRTRTGLRS